MQPDISLPPGLKNHQLLPHLRTIQQDTLGFLLDCARRYGDWVCFQAGGQFAFLVNEPEGIKHVLQDNHRNYSRIPHSTMPWRP